MTDMLLSTHAEDAQKRVDEANKIIDAFNTAGLATVLKELEAETLDALLAARTPDEMSAAQAAARVVRRFNQLVADKVTTGQSAATWLRQNAHRLEEGYNAGTD